jgi:hypothetical protein
MARSGRWRSRRPSGWAVLLAVTALVLGMTAVPSTAGPDGVAATGSISGEVRADGAPEVASQLYLYVRAGTGWTWIRSGYTGHTSAAFSFDELPPGSASAVPTRRGSTPSTPRPTSSATPPTSWSARAKR